MRYLSKFWHDKPVVANWSTAQNDLLLVIRRIGHVFAHGKRRFWKVAGSVRDGGANGRKRHSSSTDPPMRKTSVKRYAVREDLSDVPGKYQQRAFTRPSGSYGRWQLALKGGTSWAHSGSATPESRSDFHQQPRGLATPLAQLPVVVSAHHDQHLWSLRVVARHMPGVK